MRKEKPDILFQPLKKIYFGWMQNKLKIIPQFDASDGAGLKKIIKHLRSWRNDEKEVIGMWEYILNNYDRWGDFYKSQLRLRQINSNITNIINKIQNGKPSLTKAQSIEDYRDEIINSPDWRDS